MLRSITGEVPSRPEPALQRLLELTIAFALIALNGLFALPELAVVSARKPRLRTIA